MALYLNMKLTLDCRMLAGLLSQSQEDPPPGVLKARMRLHLLTCQACRNVDQQMQFIRTAMQVLRPLPPAEVAPVSSGRLASTAGHEKLET
jgi:predicted anti-sigma-YlaC factor YlaD